MYIERNLTGMNREQELLNIIGVAWGKAVRKSTIMVRERASMRRVFSVGSLPTPAVYKLVRLLSKVWWFYMVNKFFLISVSDKSISLFWHSLCKVLRN